LPVTREGGQHDRGAVFCTELARQAVAVHLRQSDIEQHECRTKLPRDVQRARAVDGRPYLVAHLLDERAHEFARILIVFDDEDPLGSDRACWVSRNNG
jgi:hypothetical protein